MLARYDDNIRWPVKRWRLFVNCGIYIYMFENILKDILQ